MKLVQSIALAAWISIPACSSEILVDPTDEPSSTMNGGSGGASTTTITTSTISDPPPPPPVCEGSLDTDPHNCGVCGHDCLGGDCQAGKCQPILLAQQDGQPWEIALDAGHVYWSNTHGEISKVPKNGGATVVLTYDLLNPGALAHFDGHLYSASYGGAVRVLSTAGGPLQSLTVAGSGGVGVTADESGVYWANGKLWPDTEALVRTDLAGKATTVISADEHLPTSVAVDGSHVYWSDFTDPSEPGGVRRAPKGGGATETLVAGDHIIQLALDDTRVYYIFGGDGANSWANGTLQSIPKAGGNPTLLASNLDGATRLAVDGSHVYWTEAYGMMIRRVPKSGGAAETLAFSDGNPQGIAADGEAVYWVDPGNGSIMKLAK